jgi:hypothetical protein
MLPFPNFTQFSIPTTATSGGMWDQIFGVYQRAFEHNSHELWTSSARIIQEHATRAWIEASQSCMTALAENAASIQQRAFTDLVGAQQEAAAIATTEMTRAVTGR